MDTDGYWFPRGDEPNSDISYYFDRYVIQNLFPAQEECQAPEDIYTTGQENDNIYLNVYYPSGEQEISFRYRKLGATDWTETIPTSNFYQLVPDLKKASEYEFQARRKCCPENWSAYSNSEIFTSAGFVPCTPLAVSGISTSSISDHNAYIYTEQPSGAVINHFRYRPAGTEDWILTNDASIYYRYLSDLLAGTEYEVQVSQECSVGGFTSFSGSFYFSTTGEKEEESGEVPKENFCASIDGNALTISSTTDYNSYIYTPQPLGAIQNQFRYRPLNSNEWLETDISNNYYRYLSILASGTAYEFQVRQECEVNTWSHYSTSGFFTTTGVVSSENEDNPEEEGTGDCSNIDVSGMFTSSVGNQNAYIYTLQPFGAIQNQFRYRPTGRVEWSLTDITTVYYRYLSDLIPATNYEFQVRQECTTNNWSDYSSSDYFTTTGGGINSKNSSDFTNQAPLTLEQLQKINPANYENLVINNPTKKQLLEAINVYPNPASSQLFLHSAIPFSENAQIRLIDKIGRIIREMNVVIGENLINIEFGDLPSGIYFIQLKMKEEFRVMKFVKD